MGAHMAALAQREEGRIQAYSFHPGLVATALSEGKLNDLTCAAVCAADMGIFVDRCEVGKCPILPDQAAATAVFLAATATAELQNGEYYYDGKLEARKGKPLGWSWETDPGMLYNMSLGWAG